MSRSELHWKLQRAPGRRGGAGVGRGSCSQGRLPLTPILGFSRTHPGPGRKRGWQILKSRGVIIMETWPPARIVFVMKILKQAASSPWCLENTPARANNEMQARRNYCFMQYAGAGGFTFSLGME